MVRVQARREGKSSTHTPDRPPAGTVAQHARLARYAATPQKPLRHKPKVQGATYARTQLQSFPLAF